jgi:hypothetical protein
MQSLFSKAVTLHGSSTKTISIRLHVPEAALSFMKVRSTTDIHLLQLTRTIKNLAPDMKRDLRSLLFELANGENVSKADIYNVVLASYIGQYIDEELSGLWATFIQSIPEESNRQMPYDYRKLLDATENIITVINGEV